GEWKLAVGKRASIAGTVLQIKAQLSSAESEGPCCPDGGPHHLSTVGMQAGRDIHGKDRCGLFVGPLHGLVIISAKVAVETGTQHAVNNKITIGRASCRERQHT